MECCIEQVKNVSVVEIECEALDAGNSKEFKQKMEPLLEKGGPVVFDMGRMRFVDSSGCGALLSCLRKLNAAGGDLKLCNVTKPVRVLFELIRLHRIFEIYNTREEAVKAFEDACTP